MSRHLFNLWGGRGMCCCMPQCTLLWHGSCSEQRFERGVVDRCVDDATVGSFTPSAAWSSGMILALGARVPGLNSQNSPFATIAGATRPAMRVSRRAFKSEYSSQYETSHIYVYIPKNLVTAATASRVWRNGSASDSRSEGWEFESLPSFLCSVCP